MQQNQQGIFIVVAGLVGAILGPIALTLVTDGLDTTFRYQVTNSDSYGYILLFTVPGGIVLGPAIGLALASIALDKEDRSVVGVLCFFAGLFCFLSICLFGVLTRQHGESLWKFVKSFFTDSSLVFLIL